MVGIGDFLTSIFCGSVVFAMIGYMAHALHKPIENIVQDGPGIVVVDTYVCCELYYILRSILYAGLAFIVIPEGLSQIPLSLVWSSLFFAMLFLLGIDSQFALVETVITFIFDIIVN